ncbi:hypothetical protein D3Y59_00960 [Hymenobacter oligotrophus]|uniref:Macroglobulin domain-containing protein n=1 Tax=Hymenobacter oligotrophus TaxID=2319843 RepID=A0A3B7RNA8_9BACT|nr:hypothetical protein [Hymenobacter oligotrophus]AYA35747.1 hypothetical protein D3Y59_00960 [Hymenobacter oligotrophus]
MRTAFHPSYLGRCRAAVAAALLGLAACPSAGAQTPAAAPVSIKQAFENYSKLDAHEKLFLHLDRTTYLGGDMMWFKVYAAEGTRQRPLPLSRVAYVEVLNGRQRPVLQAKIELKQAAGHGSFQLPATLPAGRYTVRAYTNWMKNFGPEYFFRSTVTVLNTFAAALPADTVKATPPDAQFFPEGGSLVKGLPSKVGFKVTDQAGRGLAAEGVLLDKQGKQVARFATLRHGMGQFVFTPAEAGTGYTAVLKLANDQTLTRALPAVYEQGYVLSVAPAGPGQLGLSVAANGPAAAEELYVLGHAGQHAFLAQSLRLANGQAQLVLDKAALPEGVLHFTVFNAQRQPVCERLYFRRPNSRLVIEATPDKPQYATRDKVSLRLATANGAGQPAAAGLSMAVYRLDSLAAPESAADIRSYLWLTSALRGHIENPGYYLQAPEPEAEVAADNLMLTQGWRRFRWETLLAGTPPALPHAPELNGHQISARLLNKATGAPMAGIPAYLAAPSRVVRLYNGISNPEGLVRFEARELYGPKNLVLQTNFRQDSTARFELLSPFAAEHAEQPLAPLRLTEQNRAELTQRHLQVQAQNAYFRKVLGAYAQSLTDSLAFYGRPDERYRLDDFTRFKVMEEVMREYVPGVVVRIRKGQFYFMVVDNGNRTIFTDEPMVLVDGVPFFNTDRVMKIDPLKVQRLDVVTRGYLHGPLTYPGLVSYTSYRGDMAGAQPDARALVQAYEGLQWEREFYAPRYETESQKQSRLPDLRHLLYWNPNIATTAGLPQQPSFYTGDEPGRYLVVVQGLSATGLAGSSSFTFEVKPAGVAQTR